MLKLRLSVTGVTLEPRDYSRASLVALPAWSDLHVNVWIYCEYCVFIRTVLAIVALRFGIARLNCFWSSLVARYLEHFCYFLFIKLTFLFKNMNDFMLCELVSKYKCLYDAQDKHYKDYNMKDNARGNY